MTCVIILFIVPIVDVCNLHVFQMGQIPVDGTCDKEEKNYLFSYENRSKTSIKWTYMCAL
jgi:hypothetical protein